MKEYEKKEPKGMRVARTVRMEDLRLVLDKYQRAHHGQLNTQCRNLAFCKFDSHCFQCGPMGDSRSKSCQVWASADGRPASAMGVVTILTSDELILNGRG